jgi:hypothetical protein
LMGLYYPHTSRIISSCSRHTLHTHHRGMSSSVANHTLTTSVLHHHHRQRNHSTHRRPTCDRHLPARSKIKSKAHIISSQSIMDTPIHARTPDAPKRINVKISTNISSCMRVSMSRRLARLAYVSDASLERRPIMPMVHLGCLRAPGHPPSPLPPSHERHRTIACPILYISSAAQYVAYPSTQVG